MDVQVNGHHVQVTLSKRNLEALLSKLGREGSQRTLYRFTDSHLLSVVAESDEDHYRGREAGPVHPSDEPGVK